MLQHNSVQWLCWPLHNIHFSSKMQPVIKYYPLSKHNFSIQWLWRPMKHPTSHFTLVELISKLMYSRSIGRDMIRSMSREKNRFLICFNPGEKTEEQSCDHIISCQHQIYLESTCWTAVLWWSSNWHVFDISPAPLKLIFDESLFFTFGKFKWNIKEYKRCMF